MRSFPLDSLCAGFGEIMHGMRQILAAYTAAEQAAFFCTTARRMYRTDVDRGALVLEEHPVRFASCEHG